MSATTPLDNYNRPITLKTKGEALALIDRARADVRDGAVDEEANRATARQVYAQAFIDGWDARADILRDGIAAEEDRLNEILRAQGIRSDRRALIVHQFIAPMREEGWCVRCHGVKRDGSCWCAA